MKGRFFCCNLKFFFSASLFFSLILTGVFHQNSAAKENGWPRAIEDNSFFLEEAYNQEPGVIQHISNLLYRRDAGDWLFTFTEEWPVPRETHQLSFTIPYMTMNGGAEKGIGDVMLNYRLQVSGRDDFVTAAPRLSVIIPTGSESKGMGKGVYGLQFNLPLSKRISRGFVTHLNAGITIYPNVHTENGSINLWQYNLGGSLIWLVHENFNVMAEFAAIFETGFESSKSYIISPGLRYALNIGSAQFVPGFAVPVEFADGGQNTSFFFYLSIEHQLF